MEDQNNTRFWYFNETNSSYKSDSNSLEEKVHSSCTKNNTFSDKTLVDIFECTFSHYFVVHVRVSLAWWVFFENSVLFYATDTRVSYFSDINNRVPIILTLNAIRSTFRQNGTERLTLQPSHE